MSFFGIKVGRFFKAIKFHFDEPTVQPEIYLKISHGSAFCVTRPGKTLWARDFFKVIPVGK